jgi:extracellular factor (EF) 3-hydroxypalmitic acid methyl ester biosynthesis protein
MNTTLNGGGNGSGKPAVQTRKPTPPPPPSPATAKGTQVTFHVRDEPNALQGVLSTFTRLTAVFEIYGGNPVLRVSEVLTDFELGLQGQALYAGKAVVHTLVRLGSKTVCEVTLAETDWKISGGHFPASPAAVAAEFDLFFRDWQKLCNVSAEFKVVVIDMQTFLYNLQLWLNQVELQLRALPDGQARAEHDVLTAIGKITSPLLDRMFEKFEHAAREIQPHSHAAYSAFAKRMLHSLLLCSPFLHRTFTKPLGYAGDYEMVNMLSRNPFEGATLFAKIVNLWFWEQPPALAHRNRLLYLERRIEEEALRLMRLGKTLRVFNFACGPALEVQRFLKHSPMAGRVQFLLADFNQETLDNTRRHFQTICGHDLVERTLKFQKKSVQQLLKESDKIASVAKDAGPQFDFVYCAGLFDYLPDRTCQELMKAFYNFVAPGGVLLSTNVDISNPRRPTMDMIMEWHLIYRDAKDFIKLRPEQVSTDDCSVLADVTGVNIFLECRKPGPG